MTQTVLPRISMVTASYNKGRFIAATLESVLGQGYPDLEYGVIDGASTDDSIAQIEARADQLAWWHSGPDDGLYDALNKGFSRSTGEVMGYINADDLLMPWALSVIGEVFALFPEIEWLTTLHPMAADAAGRVVRCSSRPGYAAAEFLRGGYLPDAKRPGTQWIQQESTFWRRSLWERVGGHFDATLSGAGDFELWSRFFCQAPLYGLDTPLGAFRRYGDQKSLDPTTKYKEECERVLKAGGGRPRVALTSATHKVVRHILGRHGAGLDPIVVRDWNAESWRIVGG